jgi:hypothetical protein
VVEDRRQRWKSIVVWSGGVCSRVCEEEPGKIKFVDARGVRDIIE